MKLTRINPDHSWLVETAGLRLVIDPWLMGPEIDGFGWFHTQHLPEEAWSVEDLGTIDAVLITQPFSDHCHEETLRALPASIPLIAVPSAFKRLRTIFPSGRTLICIDQPLFSDVPGLTLTALPTPFWDPTHGGVWLSSSEGSLLIAPHGYRNRSLLRTLRPAHSRPCTVLAPSMRYSLPFFLGGAVNLGLKNAHHVCQDVHAHVYIETHSSNKPSSGLARILAWIDRPDFDRVRSVISIAHRVPYRRK